MQGMSAIAPGIALLWIVAGSLRATPVVAEATNPELVVEAPGKTVVLTRAALLRRRDMESVIVDDVSYTRRMHYRAIKLAHLLSSFDIGRDATLEFVAKDGFTS